ncbi:hypothetical protein DID88_009124 [Monilinia fructigena]|uniref:Uncharacterized protein n=1 Tax=Monilinia fructigena TaxID=38457 RepID=A0A395IFW7_9HELO|nr:hypothetical protein DID88_009124 [Monilinia fructigena]
MAPWSSSRLLNSNPRVESSSSIATVGPAPESPSKNRGKARITEADILDNAYGIPTLVATPQHGRSGPSASSSSKQTSSHGRSMSHPFPSFFNSKKKGSAPSPPEVALFDDDDDDDDDVSPEKNARARSSSRVPDRDFSTGKCMTCNSSVSWPKELHTFRCKVCMTVNDLQPYITTLSNDGRKLSGGSGKSTAHPGLNKSPVVRVAPLSVEKTRRLAERCITTYLINRLKHDETDSSNILSTSPRSPEHRMTEIPQEYEHPRHFTNQSGSQAIPIRPPPPPGYGNGIGDRSNQRPGPRSMPYSTSSLEVFSVPIWKNVIDWALVPTLGPWLLNHQVEALQIRQTDSRTQCAEDKIMSPKNLFRPLEEYIIASFSQFDCINTSFSTTRQGPTPRAGSQSETSLEELDPRMLMLGDIAENGSWWTGNQKEPPRRLVFNGLETQYVGILTAISPQSNHPRIDWPDLNEWYHIVSNPGRIWHRRLEELTLRRSSPVVQTPTDVELAEIEETIMEAQSHLQRTVLKATEGLLKRPGRPLKEPDNLRFLLIILANPLLYPGNGTPSRNAGVRIPPNDQRPEVDDPSTRGQPPLNYHQTLQRGLWSTLGNH